MPRILAKKILSALGVDALELSLVLLDDAEMAAINGEHRRKAEPTDVLSFPLEEKLCGRFSRDSAATAAAHLKNIRDELARRAAAGPEPMFALGDVLVDVPYARRQARELGESLEEAYARLLAHGITHLLGYDHERGPAWEKAMQRLETHLRKAALKQ